MIIEYTGAQQLKGTLLFFDPIEDVQYGEKVIVRSGERTVNGKVVALSRSVMLIEILGEAYGLDLDDLKVHFTGTSFELGVSESMLGRVMNAFGEAVDNSADEILYRAKAEKSR